MIYRYEYIIPPYKKTTEIEKWIKENIKGSVWVEHMWLYPDDILFNRYGPIPNGTAIRFCSSVDAMAFKLKWAETEWLK